MFILLIFLSCNSGRHGLSGREEEAFINTFVELTLAQAKYNARPREYETTVKHIYEQNNTSPEKMKEYLQKISNNMQQQQEIYSAIAERLKNLEEFPADSVNKILKPLLNRP